MALTPEDVINKRFQPTKFREGYDQDEVDDFLDEIVVELRRLNQENADLREQLEAGGSAERSGTDTAAPAPAAGSTATAEDSAPEAVADQDPAIETAQEAPAPAAADEQATTAAEPAASAQTSASGQTAAAQPEAPAAGTASDAEYADSAQSAAGVLAMAQKLHDQYVSEGRSERDRLIAEGRAQADTLVSDAETSKAEVLSSLEEERRGLEDAVSGLRSFESSYKERLTAFIDGQLQEIKAAPSLAPEDSGESAGQSR